jgi:hypothetical protein
MKYFFLIFGLLGLMFTQCKEKSPTINGPDLEEKLVGHDEDPHGCKPSAGYKYSQAKAGCIRLWEDGYRFVNVTEPGTPNSGIEDAFVVFSNDYSLAEIFWSEDQRPTLLPRALESLQINDAEVMFSSPEENVSIVKNKKGWSILLESSPIYFFETAEALPKP